MNKENRLEETAQVVAIEQGHAVVQTQRQSACGQCRMKAGCGSGILSSLWNPAGPKLSINNRLNARIGDRVVLSIAPSALIQASALMYLMPLISMLALAVLCRLLLPKAGEGFQIIAALFGLLAGFYLIRRRYSAAESNHHAIIMERVLDH